MHSLVFVIVPKIGPALETEVSRLASGGWREFDTYEQPCSCIGSVAHNESWKQVDTSPDGVEWLRDLKTARGRHDADTEREILRQRYRRVRSIEENHPHYGRIDEACDICSGRGVNQYSRDPAQHHDWWVVGGRWDGLLGPVSGIAGNVARLADLTERICPAAVITADGDWYEGPMTIAAIPDFREPADVPEEEIAAIAAWRQTFAAFAEHYRGHFAVAVDCHF